MANTNYDDIVQQKLLRYTILYEFKLGRLPPEICENIQKIFGSNSETSLSTIERWFKQFSLGNENLDNFSACKSKEPSIQLKNLAVADSTPPNDTQTKLLWQLKDQVDHLYQKINAQDCCLQLVDRFLKPRSNKSKIQLSGDSQDYQQKLVDTFCKEYRFLRRKCRKINNSSFYEILYDSLYSCDKKMEETKNDTNKKVETPEYIKEEEEESSCFPVHLENSMISLPNSSIAVQIKSKTTKLVGLKGRLRRSTKSTLPDNHLDEQQSFACGQCDKVFKTKERLKIHVKYNHELADRFRCSFEGCTANFAFSSELNWHIRKVHSKKAPVKPKPTPQNTPVDAQQPTLTCDQCGKVLKSKAGLKFHMKQDHERTDRYRCTFEGCTANYSFNSQLYHHIRVVHNKKEYRCNDCSFETFSLYMLRKHRSVHRNEADKYRCSECSYVSFSPTGLRRHMRKHTDHRPHKCIWPECGQSFKTTSGLLVHRKFHENQREYKCQLRGCGSAFNTKNGLNRHLRNIHQLEPNVREKIDHDQAIKVES